MKKFCLLICIVVFPVLAFCVDITELKFDHISVNDGLSQNNVEYIFQDSRGFIWIGTQDGLNLYDGLSFSVFRSDRTDPNSLIDNKVTAIGEDSEGKIWIGSNGLNIYDPELEKLTRVEIGTGNDRFHGGIIHKIEQDRDHSLWIASSNGLVHYIPESNSFETYVNDPDNNKSIGNNVVLDVLINSENRIFVTTQETQFYEFNRSSGEFSPLYLPDDIEMTPRTKWIKEGPDKRLYITSDYHPLYIYDLSSDNYEIVDLEQYSSVNSTKSKVAFYGHDEVLFGTDGGGLCVYNIITKSVTAIKEDTRNEYSIHGNAIYDILQDKDGNIWIGHFGRGISIWRKNKYKFTSYSHNPINPNSIGNGVVSALFEDSSNRIWIGLDGGGLCYFDRSANSFERYNHNPEDEKSIPSDVILTIAELDDGNLLMGTFLKGMFIFDPESGEVVEVFNTNAFGNSDLKNVWKILRAQDGNFWIVDNGSGVIGFDPNTKAFFDLDGYENFIQVTSPNIYTAELAPDGKLWLGTEDKGICILDPSQQSIKSYLSDENDFNSLGSNNIKAIALTDKFAWVGTNGGGLSRIDLFTDSIKTYTMQDGMTSNSITGILKDDNGLLWLSSRRGIMKFNPQKEEFISYDLSQGIQGYEFKDNSQLKLQDGRMIFGGSDGITIFNPDSIQLSNLMPAIVFKNLLINSVPAVIGADNSPLRKNIDDVKSIKIKHTQRIFSLEFISLDYTNPEKNKFRYMLEGYDKDWIDAGTNNFANYSNLKAGVYTFKVQGSNSDGLFFNDNERSIKIKVRPPWYLTKVFIILIILIIAYSIYRLSRTRAEHIKNDKLLLQKKIDEGKAEIDAKVREIEEQKAQISLKEEEEYEMRFQTEGIAKFSELITKKRKDVEELSTSLISELVSYIGANAGAVFIVDDSDPVTVTLNASGKFCYDSDMEKHYQFESGEGYVGTCYLEKKTLKIDNLAEGYIVLRSGLGDVSLKQSIFVPIIQENTCLGVLELASIEKIDQYKIQFVEKISETFASVLAITRANEKTREMLEQNQIQSEELMAQEEEMRQNLEEMAATQEDLKRQMEENSKMQKTVDDYQKLLISVLDHIPGKIFVKDHNHALILLNSEVAKVYNTTVDKLLGTTDFDNHPEEDAREYQAKEKEIMEKGEETYIQEEKLSGETKFLKTTKMPFYLPHLDTTGLLGIQMDVTDIVLMEQEIKQQNEELQAQEEELRQNLEEMQATQDDLTQQIEENKKMHKTVDDYQKLLISVLDHIPGKIFVKDHNHALILLNSEVAKVYNTTVDKLLGTTDFDNHPEEDAKVYQAKEKEIMEKGEETYVQEEKLSGETKYLKTTKMPFYLPHLDKTGLLGIQMDVTDMYLMEHEIKQQNEELQAQEEELRQNLEEMLATQEDLQNQIKSSEEIQEKLTHAKAFLDAILDNLPDYIYFKDTDSKFYRVSKSMLPLFPVKNIEEMIGKSDFDFHRKEAAQEFFNEEQNIIKTGKSIIDKIVHEITQNGKEQWVSTTKMPLLDSKGECIGTFGISKDVSPRIVAENKVKELNEEILKQQQRLNKTIEELKSKLALKENEIKELQKFKKGKE